MAAQVWSGIFNGQPRPFFKSTGWPALAAWLALAFVLPSPALCAITGPGKTELFGHDVVIRSFVKHNDDEMTETDVLSIDKKVLLKDRQVYVWDSGSADGTRLAIGMHSTGAMCDNNFFVLVFPERGTPRIDATLQACAVRYAIEKDQVIFETFYSPPAAEDETLRSRWIWTAHGLSPEQHFKMKTGQLAQLLQSRSISQPSELLEHAEFAEQVEQLAKSSGFSEDALFRSIKGPGTVRYDGNVMFAQACQAGDCGVGSLLIAVDLASNKLYLALKSGAAAATVAPDRASWPAATTGELTQWMSQRGSRSKADAAK